MSVEQEKGQKDGTWTVEHLRRGGWLRGYASIKEAARACLQEQERRMQELYVECDSLPPIAASKQRQYLDALARAMRQSLSNM